MSIDTFQHRSQPSSQRGQHDDERHGRRPVWLFSMDSDQFHAAPTTTGGLKAFYQAYGEYAEESDIELLHFRDGDEIAAWSQAQLAAFTSRANAAIAEQQWPVVGFSFYTWNAAEFLLLVRQLRAACPQLLIVAGGPHVQEADPYLQQDPIDLVVLGEGEQTITAVLDATQSLAAVDWGSIDGLAWLDTAGAVCRSAERKREIELDKLPSALDVLALTDANGEPLYDSLSYETSRGCPFKCAFCEWGTGMLGTKMYQYSMARIERDWRKVAAAGIKNIWLADSNFGALKEDVAKARLICELKETTGLPRTFATSWSKKHSPKVQEIVLMLHAHDLLPHYQLALQTLTPLALELSNRKNMAANKYEPIAREMARAGVPIAAELIWGLPGDNLEDFETNLDRLLATFPNINIFGYTLLPGTEFFEKRAEYQIDAIPVAGYGKAKGEYVVGCHTFGREEGIEGYFLIAAHMILIHGHITPLLIRYLAMEGKVPATPLLRVLLGVLIDAFAPQLKGVKTASKMDVYECRAALYLAFLADTEKTFAIIRNTLADWLSNHGASSELSQRVMKVLSLDEAYCPREGRAVDLEHAFDFGARELSEALEALDLPEPEIFEYLRETVTIHHPGGVGEVLKDPDGGSWIRGRLLPPNVPPAELVSTVQL